jgi:hypothetical protein
MSATIEELQAQVKVLTTILLGGVDKDLTSAIVDASKDNGVVMRMDHLENVAAVVSHGISPEDVATLLGEMQEGEPGIIASVSALQYQAQVESGDHLQWLELSVKQWLKQGVKPDDKAFQAYVMDKDPVRVKAVLEGISQGKDPLALAAKAVLAKWDVIVPQEPQEG